MPNRHERRATKTTKSVALDEQEILSRAIPIKRIIPHETQALYCDGLVIQTIEETFVMSFLKTTYPLEDKLEEMAKIKEIEQRCVAQIVISPMQMAKNLNILNKNFKKFMLNQPPETRAMLNEVAELPMTEAECTQPPPTS